MTGFPLRHLLQFFGPKLRDARPIENPEIETGQHRLNLTESIAAASSLLLSRASVIAELNTTTGAPVILYQEEAWNVKHDQNHPVLERLAVGIYAYRFASSYLDSDGVPVQMVVHSARLSVCPDTSSGGNISYGRSSFGIGISESGAPYVEVYIKDDTFNAFVDKRFWLEVF